MSNPTEPDTRGLAQQLESALEGEVRFSDSDRALYSTDASNYRQLPLGVVVPKRIDDIVAATEICRQHGASMFMRGAGTSLAGQCCNDGVVMDTSKYLDRLVELDPDARTATVEPGVICDSLRNAANRHGLTFGPDPATHDRCTIGGMIGNNSCGVRSVWAGKTVENVEELEVLTYEGLRTWVGATSETDYERITGSTAPNADLYLGLRALVDGNAAQIRDHFPQLPRRVSGYNLDELLPERGFNLARSLVGSESTCAIVLRAKVKLLTNPPAHCLAVLGFEDVFSAADRVPEILTHSPIGLEGMDEYLIQCVRTMKLSLQDLPMLPAGGGWLLAEFGGEDSVDARRKAEDLVAALGNGVNARIFDDPGQQARIWLIRKSALGATSFVPGQPPAWAGWEDSAVPPDRLGEYLRGLVELMSSYGYKAALYGHFGDGCVHTRIPFDLRSAPGIAAFRSFVEEAADLTLAMGGSLSGEHGDGQARGSLLPKMFGPRLMEAFRTFKRIWDPAGKMNPGKLVDAYPVDEHLRLGTAYRPSQAATMFAFPNDPEGFAGAATRCVGVGRCRNDTGVMCPSYMVTREEKHSTRGRARLLFELLQEGPRARDSEQGVKEALDLCLACKGCKSECPVNVDMATYKAEFLSHYYRRRLRPSSAYSMGLIHWWLSAGSRAPGLANALLAVPGVESTAKKLGGIAPQRRIPRLAEIDFRRGFTAPAAPESGGPPVLLWPDTFNAFMHPEVLHAGVDVLAGAGCRVSIPPRSLCCGRPLYDFGMLGLARRQLRQILDVLEPQISDGTPVVVLEPSCLAVFRDEMTNLLPDDARAARLKQQSFSLAEFLTEQLEGYEPPRMPSSALLHGHCHHKSVIGMGPDRKLLEGIGLDLTVPDSGCCGMAGAFGFEKEHYDVSIACGERVLLPAVRDTGAQTLLITDGFSCREQIAQTTGRDALHAAQVLRMASRRR
ncbi:MAG: FAD-binding and (Fe-S)-binding domain-containing protein [Actinomycetota bacterium]